jgi:hypothetical protein
VISASADDGTRIEGRALDAQLSGLSLGEVEDVVQQRDEGHAVALDGATHAALIVRQLGLRQELRPAEHGCHGVADLVAHGGEDAAARLHGRLRRFQGAPELALDAAAVRDVLGGDHGDRSVLERERRPILPPAVDLGHHRGVRLRPTGGELPQVKPLRPGEQRAEVGPEHAVRREAPSLLRRGVARENAAGEVGGENRSDHRTQCGEEQLTHGAGGFMTHRTRPNFPQRHIIRRRRGDVNTQMSLRVSGDL